MLQQAELEKISEHYARFASDQARGSSEVHEKLALAVAQSSDLLEFIATFPVEKRQPNLFLASVRHVCGVAGNADELRQFVRTHQAQIREVMLSRTTQTNEPARCAVLLPLLAQLPQPLALLEVSVTLPPVQNVVGPLVPMTGVGGMGLTVTTTAADAALASCACRVRMGKKKPA